MVHMVIVDSEQAQVMKGPNKKVSGLGRRLSAQQPPSQASVTGQAISSLIPNRMTVLRMPSFLVNLNNLFPVSTYTMYKQL